MPKTDRFVEFAVEQFSPLGEITARAMMGGWILYCDGVVFALVASGALYLKGDDATIANFQARGLEAFRPFPDKEGSMRYFQAPPEIFEDREAMREWVGGAVEAGRRAKKTKPKKAKKTH
jgi:DNA transformation protein